MSTTSIVPPIRCSIGVRCAPEHAFRTYTERIAAWWPLGTHAIDAARARTAVFEPGVGGRIFERWDDGSEHEWGRVTVWEPPARVVFDWQPDHDRPSATEVEIRFSADGEGTRVDVEHRAWERLGADAFEARGSYESGWPVVLELYAAAAAD